MKDPQNPWEETAEEARRRVEAAKSSQTGWTGTIVGLALAALALVGLALMPPPSSW